MYKLNNIEVSAEQIRELVKSNPEILEDKKEFKFFRPKTGDNYYCCTPDNTIVIYNCDDVIDRANTLRGVYRTEAEAKKADEKRMALVRLWNNADSSYYFRPDWSDYKQAKYTVSYFINLKIWHNVCHTTVQENFLLPEFSCSKHAEQFIKENLADLEIIRS